MAKTLAKIFGIVFVVVAVLGMIGTPIVGEAGFFHTNLAHDLVHLLFGVILLAASGTAKRASTWLIILGIVYLALAALGFITGGDTLLGIVHINHNDNILHIALGVVTLGAGLVSMPKKS